VLPRHLRLPSTGFEMPASSPAKPGAWTHRRSSCETDRVGAVFTTEQLRKWLTHRGHTTTGQIHVLERWNRLRRRTVNRLEPATWLTGPLVTLFGATSDGHLATIGVDGTLRAQASRFAARVAT